ASRRDGPEDTHAQPAERALGCRAGEAQGGPEVAAESQDDRGRGEDGGHPRHPTHEEGGGGPECRARPHVGTSVLAEASAEHRVDAGHRHEREGGEQVGEQPRPAGQQDRNLAGHEKDADAHDAVHPQREQRAEAEHLGRRAPARRCERGRGGGHGASRTAAYFAARSTISITSSVCTRSSSSFALMPSVSIVMQKGHDTAMTSGLAWSASSVRSKLTRLSAGSSIHMRPPPAPQQRAKLWWRCGTSSTVA